MQLTGIHLYNSKRWKEDLCSFGEHLSNNRLEGRIMEELASSRDAGAAS